MAERTGCALTPVKSAMELRDGSGSQRANITASKHLVVRAQEKKMKKKKKKKKSMENTY